MHHAARPAQPLRIPLLTGGFLIAAAIVLAACNTVVGAGTDFTCVVRDGDVFCWGANTDGQLGDGTTEASDVPVQVAGLSGVTELVTGDRHACARDDEDTVLCWGANTDGQLGDGTTTDRSTPAPVLGLSPVKALTAGQRHSCAVSSAGVASCWGANDLGQLGDATTTPSNVPVVVVDLPADGFDLSAGANHTCSVSKPGRITCWGSDSHGQLGDNGDIVATDFSSSPVEVVGLAANAGFVSAGELHTCAASNISGAAVPLCWGDNTSGQLGDGSVVASSTPVSAGVLDTYFVAAGGAHSCAMSYAGSVTCWGANDLGQLGIGDTAGQPVLVPTAVTGLQTDAEFISAGTAHTCAKLTSGSFSCWGDNSSGQHGNNGLENSDLPVQLPEQYFRDPAGHLEVLLYAKAAQDPWFAAPTAAEWDWYNENYDHIVGFVPFWNNRIQYYPDKLFAYRTSYAIYDAPGVAPREPEFPDWIFRTEAGDPVYIPWNCGIAGGCPQYAGDLTKPEFRAHLIENIRDNVVTPGHYGLMLDDVNFEWRFSDADGNLALPVKPDGQVLSVAEWQIATLTFLEEVRAEFPDLRIMHNSLWFTDSPAFDNARVDQQILAADKIMMERGANDQGLVNGTGRYSLRSLLAFVDRVHSHDRNVLWLDEDATTVEAEWYNLGVALLTNNGDDIVSTENTAYTHPDTFWEGFSTDLGFALGDRYDHQSVIRRDFDDGSVFVAEPPGYGDGPTDVTFTVDTPMTDQYGTTGTAFTLQNREALILTPAG